jgi:prepilin-type N-terminal cleavage/methylation domain-containing protein
MQVGKNKNGFTIVELLIVIVVIGILAAITIVAFNGVTKRASISAVQSELEQNAKVIMATVATSATGQLSTIDAMPGGAANIRMTLSRYKVVTYCTDGISFVLAAQLPTGEKYYVKNNSTPVLDNTIDAFSPCTSLSIAGARITYLNLPTPCTVQLSPCTYTGPATLVYGSIAQASFLRVLNDSSSTCDDSLGDPASGYIKSCYVYPN